MTVLSASLQPLLDLELRYGNEVQRIDEPAGSKSPYAMILRFKLHFPEARKELVIPTRVTRWQSTDPHYPCEAGYLCHRTHHVLAGPL
jgi:hypothetical protein